MLDVRPLRTSTQKVLSREVFNNHPISGGCLSFQSLAERIKSLNDLKNQYENGSLSSKEQIWAITKCVGAALLVAASVAFIFLIISHFPFAAHAASGDALGIIYATATMPLFASCALFVLNCANACKIYNTPSPEQVQKQLEEIAEKKLSEKDFTEMAAVKEVLEDKIFHLQVKIDNANKIGSAEATRLECEKENIEFALNDINQLQKALNFAR